MLLLVAPADAAEAGGESAASHWVTLHDGSRLAGRLADEALEVTSQGATRSLSAAEIGFWLPGLARRPELLRSVRRLVKSLGAATFRERMEAARQLRQLGPQVRGELEAYRNDRDAERRYRIEQLLEEWSDGGPARPRQDRLTLTRDDGETEIVEGTVRRGIVRLATAHGLLRIPLDRVLSVRRDDYRGRVDLLRRLRPNQQALRGDWKLEQGVLISPGDTPWALLPLGVRPPDAYTLRATVTRVAGSDALVFPIIVGGRECNVCLDGWPREGKTHSGLEMINGRGPLNNETRHQGTLLVEQKKTDLRIQVDKSSVRLDVDGRPIFHWKGSPQAFSMQPGWRRRDTTVLAIGCYNACFHISRLEMIPRSADPPPVQAAADQLVVELKDGTRLVAQPAESARLVLALDADRRHVPLSEIRSLERMDPARRRVTLRLADGDELTAEIQPGRLKLVTGFGELAVPAEELSRMLRPSSDGS